MIASLNSYYIAGSIESIGKFSFVSTDRGMKSPCFSLWLDQKNIDFLIGVKNSLKLRNTIYFQKRTKFDDYKRNQLCGLVVRDFGQIKNVIIPFCNEKLVGNKWNELEDWILAMENNPAIPERYALLPRLWKSGFFKKNTKFS